MMNKLKTTMLVLIVLVVAVSLGFAAGEMEKGKALFNNPTLGGGTSGKSCNTCHPNGKGLEGIGAKKEWTNPVGKYNTLEAAVNICIVKALQGKPLDEKSEQMQDLIAYLKSIK